MFLTRISVGQPVFATMVMVAMLVFGIYSYQRLPIEQLPDIDLPVVAVVELSGASPEAVKTTSSGPIEEAVPSNGRHHRVDLRPAGESHPTIMDDYPPQHRCATASRRSPASAGHGILGFQVLIPRTAGHCLPSVRYHVGGDLTLTEDVIVSRLANIRRGRASVNGGVPRQLIS